MSHDFPKLSIQSAAGNIYEFDVAEDDTVADVKQRLREEDWTAWAVADQYEFKPTGRAHLAETRRNSQVDDLEHQVDPPAYDDAASSANNEFDALLSSDRRTVLPGNTRIRTLLPSSDDDAELSQSTRTPKNLKLYYRLTRGYPTYADLLKAAVRRHTGVQNQWASRALLLTVDAVIVVVGALFVAAFAQASFNLPQAWSTYINVETAVPVTFQTFAVLAISTLLGSVRGFMALGVYACFIAVGAPFAAEHIGGHAVLIGASAGFIYGFIVEAAIVGYLAERGWDRQWKWIILSMLIGEVVMYIIGLIFLPFGIAMTQGISAHDAVCGYGRGCVGNTLWYGMVPFLPGDAIKIIMACLVLPIGWKLLGVRASQAIKLRDATQRRSNSVDYQERYVVSEIGMYGKDEHNA